MKGQFLVLQSFCVVLIALFAYGGQLPKSISSQYTYCFEFSQSFDNDASTYSSQSSPHSHLDNLCIDSNKSTLHFLSSAQGRTTSSLAAPISEITVYFLFRDTLGIQLGLSSQPVVGLHCIFEEPAHALDVYNSIYQRRRLNRENVMIGRIQAFHLDPERSDLILGRLELSQNAVLYSEFYRSTQIILTFREEGVNGDTVLVFVANKFDVSDVLHNNNVVLRFRKPSPGYYVLTFRDKSAAKHFHSCFRGYFGSNTLVSIPAGLKEFLDVVMSIFES